MGIESYYRRKRMKDEKLRSKKREEALAVLRDMDTDNELTPDGIFDAVIEGKIPNVYFKE